LGDQKYSSGRCDQLSFQKDTAQIHQTISGKPIIVSKVNRVKKKQPMRRREMVGEQVERDRARARIEESKD
jgi:hypothetical protein